jgi:uncharacterized membrane protein HdeD (DUF308 family)
MNNFTGHFHEIEKVKKQWGWFFLLGLLLTALGIFAVRSSILTTVISVLFLGFLFISGGILQIIHSFMAKKWSGLFTNLLLGILYLICGSFFVIRPDVGAITLTLLAASLFLVGGFFRAATALLVRFSHWGFVFFNGLFSILLGLLIFSEWPLSGLWVIGLFVGIDMIFVGLSWAVLALRVRRLS